MTNTPNINQDVVLVVEDTAANHEVIQTFLNDIHVKCESAFDGMEAVTMCSAVNDPYYSLILMDINLPHMDGFETAAKIRSLGIQAPIIAITATSKEDDRLKEARTVFDHLLFKPFNSYEFFSAISPYIKSAASYSLEQKNIQKIKKNHAMIDSQICDVDKAIQNMGSNSRLFIKHFNNFKRNNADLALRLSTLIQHGEYTESALLCHSIKGLSGMLGFVSLYDHIVALEHILKTTAKLPISSLPLSGEISDETAALLICIRNDIRLICQMQI